MTTRGDRGVDWIKIPLKAGEDVCVILFGVNPWAVRGAFVACMPLVIMVVVGDRSERKEFSCSLHRDTTMVIRGPSYSTSRRGGILLTGAP